MGLNWILMWLTGAWSVIALMRVSQSKSAVARGWRFKFSAILITLALLNFVAFPIAGYVCGLLYLVFVMVPMRASQMVMDRILQQRYDSAYKIGRAFGWLHPFDGWRDNLMQIKALDLASRGDFASARQILSSYAGYGTQLSRIAHVQLFRMSGQWEEMLAWLQSHYSEEQILQFQELDHWYLRALAETGDLNGMLLAYDKLLRTQHPIYPLVLDLCRIIVFAFSGSRADLERLFTGSLRALPHVARRFWFATADMVSTDEEGARRELETQLQTATPMERIAIERRLNKKLPLAPVTLTPRTREIVEQASLDLLHEQRIQKGNEKAGTPVVTYAIIAVNVIAFFIELFAGGSTDMPTLDRLGTLIPDLVVAGQWWRTVTALFLHYGPLHIGMNMLGLYYLGPFVESSQGRARYAFTYFLSGIGSMLVIVVLTQSGLLRNNSTLGASGCVMGLVGATGAILFRIWRSERSTLALRRLRMIGIVILMQVLFDLTTPEISFTGHFAGTIIGFLVSLI